MAMGATTGSEIGLVLRKGVLIAGAGVVVGLLASLALSRAVTSLLYGVSATDPLTFGTIAVLVLVVAGVASFLPARRATNFLTLKPDEDISERQRRDIARVYDAYPELNDDVFVRENIDRWLR